MGALSSSKNLKRPASLKKLKKRIAEDLIKDDFEENYYSEIDFKVGQYLKEGFKMQGDAFSKNGNRDAQFLIKDSDDWGSEYVILLSKNGQLDNEFGGSLINDKFKNLEGIDVSDDGSVAWYYSRPVQNVMSVCLDNIPMGSYNYGIRDFYFDKKNNLVFSDSYGVYVNGKNILSSFLKTDLGKTSEIKSFYMNQIPDSNVVVIKSNNNDIILLDGNPIELPGFNFNSFHARNYVTMGRLNFFGGIDNSNTGFITNFTQYNGTDYQGNPNFNSYVVIHHNGVTKVDGPFEGNKIYSGPYIYLDETGQLNYICTLNNGKKPEKHSVILNGQKLLGSAANNENIKFFISKPLNSDGTGLLSGKPGLFFLTPKGIFSESGEKIFAIDELLDSPAFVDDSTSPELYLKDNLIRIVRLGNGKVAMEYYDEDSVTCFKLWSDGVSISGKLDLLKLEDMSVPIENLVLSGCTVYSGNSLLALDGTISLGQKSKISFKGTSFDMKVLGFDEYAKYIGNTFEFKMNNHSKSSKMKKGG